MWGKVLLGLFLLLNYKALPLAYYFRFYSTVVQFVLIPYYKYGGDFPLISQLQADKYACFSTTVLKTYNSIFETDMCLHKSNSTYFVDMDIARTELMSKIFSKLFMTSKKWPFIPVGSISATFKKEIKPLQAYTIETNILCWDEKWLYIACKFYLKDSKKGKILATYGLTKYVLKEGRKTIIPSEALQQCGLYNEEVASINAKNLKVLMEENGLVETDKLIDLEHSYAYI